ncbi:MAG: o-succinylbenzoate synthase [Actinomycetota bacterium]|nr:o-succinylbenzoate synthase [Actinomycetota bacterium]
MTRLRSVELRLISLPLVRPFRTSFGEETTKDAVLVRIETGEGAGWGECVAGPDPRYSEEFNDEVWLTLRDHLVPSLLDRDIRAESLAGDLAWARGHRMAKAALEMALLDAELQASGRSLAEYLGADKDRVACGVSVGITRTLEELLKQVGGYLADGYLRIKLKIEPGTDLERVRTVREAHPDIALSVDANAAYTLEDAPLFRALDELELLMIEQPLRHDDLLDHAKLQREIRTPLCLDESIRSAMDAAAAIELGACRIVNIKQGRVGGLLESRRIHDLARAAEVPVWCGGMLETGIGRAANLALAALPGFTLPGDTSASQRYFAEDLTEPFVLDPDGTIAVPSGPGLGVAPDPGRLERCTLRIERFGKG